MFYLVQFSNETYGIYPQRSIFKENSTACLVKHKGSKYEAIILKKNGKFHKIIKCYNNQQLFITDSIKILEETKNNYEFLREVQREKNKKLLLDINNCHTVTEVVRSSITDSNYSLSDTHDNSSSKVSSEENTSRPILKEISPVFRTESVDSDNTKALNKNTFEDNVMHNSNYSSGSTDVIVEKDNLSACSTDDSKLLTGYDSKIEMFNKYPHANVPVDKLVETVDFVLDSLISGNTDESNTNINGFDINTPKCLDGSGINTTENLNGTFIISFECQPGDIIDLNNTKIISSLCSSPFDSSTPQKQMNVISSYTSHHDSNGMYNFQSKH